MQEVLNWTLFNDITLNAALDKDILEATIVRTASSRSVIYTNGSQFKFYSDMFFKQHQYTIDELVKTMSYEYNPIYNYDRTEEEDGKVTNERNGNKVDVGTSSSERDYNATKQDTHSGTDTRNVDNDITNDGTDSHKITDTKSEKYSGVDMLNDTGHDDVTHGGTTKTVSTASGSGTDNNTANSDVTNSVAAFNSSSYANHDKTHTDNTSKIDTTSSTDTTSTTTHGETVKTELNTQHQTRYGKTIDTSDTNTVTDTYGKTINDKTQDKLAYGHVIHSIDESKDTVSESDKNTQTYDDNGTTITDRKVRMYGNIGVKTTQSMIEEQRTIVQFDIYDLIAKMYCDELFNGIYFSERKGW